MLEIYQNSSIFLSLGVCLKPVCTDVSFTETARNSLQWKYDQFIQRKMASQAVMSESFSFREDCMEKIWVDILKKKFLSLKAELTSKKSEKSHTPRL